VKNYIEEARIAGHDEQSIKDVLKKRGWKEHIIHTAFHDVHEPGDDRKLTSYMRDAIALGMSKKQIEEGLEKAGWKKTHVEKAWRGLRK
jgi:SOS response regulatory protein OraA/RecX